MTKRLTVHFDAASFEHLRILASRNGLSKAGLIRCIVNERYHNHVAVPDRPLELAR